MYMKNKIAGIWVQCYTWLLQYHTNLLKPVRTVQLAMVLRATALTWYRLLQQYSFGCVCYWLLPPKSEFADVKSQSHPAFDIPSLHDRLNELGVLLVGSAKVDEEQEREVSQELEREYQVTAAACSACPTCRARPCTPACDPRGYRWSYHQ